MFRLLTILFLMYYIYRLINPINYREIMAIVKKLNKKEIDFENIDSKDLRIIIFVYVIVAWQMIEFIYLCFAIKHDIFKYPSVTMLLWFVIVYSIQSRKKKGIDLDKYEKLKYRIKRKLIGLVDITYFGYMFYLMFWIK